MTKIIKVIPIVMLVCIIFTSVLAYKDGIDIPTNEEITGVADPTITNAAENVWATIKIIVRYLAVAAIIFAGLRYMFASANQKTDIKKSMLILVLGAVLVFRNNFNS